MTSAERFQKQFERCFQVRVNRKSPPARGKTGIEREMEEREETARMWSELKEGRS